MTIDLLSRREATVLLTSLALFPATLRAAESPPVISVTKDPNCGCCSGWVDYLKQAGFKVDVTETADLNPLKAKLGVPRDLAGCHTAQIDGYVLEGHVPVQAIRRLLAERPNARGLAVPGMPVGSPGMETDGTAPEPYTVTLFGDTGRRPYGHYLGAKERS